MTDSGGRLIIRFDNGETLISPDGWPDPAPPTLGESPMAWMERAVFEDPFVQSIQALGVELMVPSPAKVRPAEQTMEWWAREWPEKRGEPVPASRWMFPEDFRRLLNYELGRAAWRVRVVICGRLLAGDPAMKGRTGPAYSVKPVPLGLLRNPDMELQRDGGYRPVQRRGHPPPSPELPVFGELVLSGPVPRRGGGRRQKYNWADVRTRVLERLRDYGAPIKGDGGQAELERFVADLFPSDACPAESVIRQQVCAIIDGFRHELG